MIIIVEDNLTNQAAISHMLKTITNESVVLFTNGLEAVSFIEKHKNDISLVILDGNLANPFLAEKIINGPDVAAEVIKINKEISIAAWTTDSVMLKRFNDVCANASKAYFTLNKPLTSFNLKNIIQLSNRKNLTAEPSANTNDQSPKFA